MLNLACVSFSLWILARNRWSSLYFDLLVALKEQPEDITVFTSCPLWVVSVWSNFMVIHPVVVEIFNHRAGPQYRHRTSPLFLAVRSCKALTRPGWRSSAPWNFLELTWCLKIELIWAKCEMWARWVHSRMRWGDVTSNTKNSYSRDEFNCIWTRCYGVYRYFLTSSQQKKLQKMLKWDGKVKVCSLVI